MTYIILSNDQMVKLSPRANPDYVRRVLEGELIGAVARPDRRRPRPQRRSLLQQVVGWILRKE